MKQDELSEEYKADLQLHSITKTANGIISTAKVIGLAVLIAGIAIISAIAPIDVVIVASIILAIGYFGFAGDNYGPQGCLEAIWGTIKYIILLMVLFLAFYAFMTIR